MILVLLCCQYGVSYRIYILPEPGAFCLGVFSGDDCITWEDYSANPTFFDRSATLVFTPGNYSLLGRNGQLSMTNIKTLIMIGDGAQLQFQLSLSNVGYVGVYNLTFQNSGIDIVNVDHFVMENCNLYDKIPPWFTRLSFSTSYSRGLNEIVNSTFENIVIDIRSNSLISITIAACLFTNYSTSAITGDSYSSVTIQSSRFINLMTSGNLVCIQGSFSESLTVIDCLFDRISGGGTLYSSGNMRVTNCNFTSNELASGYAVIGYRNITISNCIFKGYTQSRSVIYFPQNSYQTGSRIYITDSRFYHCNRPIYSQLANVTVNNGHFFNITSTAGDGGGVIYSSNSVTLTNCTIMNSTAEDGHGGAVYSEGRISVLNSLFVNNSAMAANSRGGTLYSSQLTTVTNCSIINSFSAGYGGAIYGGAVNISNTTLSTTTATMDGGAVYSINTVIVVNSSFSGCRADTGDGGAIYSRNTVSIINSTISECSALNGNGGAIFSAARLNQLVLSRSTFNNNSASSGGVLYTSNGYNIRFSDSTFKFNKALGSITGGGVACVGNAALWITNSTLT
jgi:hypothetical protein